MIYRNSQLKKLKITETKRGKDSKKNSKINASVKWKQPLKSGEVYFAKRQETSYDEILGNVLGWIELWRLKGWIERRIEVWIKEKVGG